MRSSQGLVSGFRSARLVPQFPHHFRLDSSQDPALLQLPDFMNRRDDVGRVPFGGGLRGIVVLQPVLRRGRRSRRFSWLAESHGMIGGRSLPVAHNDLPHLPGAFAVGEKLSQNHMARHPTAPLPRARSAAAQSFDGPVDGEASAILLGEIIDREGRATPAEPTTDDEPP